MPACFTCGRDGHIARNCDVTAETSAGDGRPMWCGTCDERSRHIELADGRVKRCRCHPESHKMLPQHRRCPSCQALVVAWDTNPCGQHAIAGVTHPYAGPPVEIIPDTEDQLRQLAAQQVARARLARVVHGRVTPASGGGPQPAPATPPAP